MTTTSVGYRLPRRERTIALASLLGVATLAWYYLWRESSGMAAMPGKDIMAMAAMAEASRAWSRVSVPGPRAAPRRNPTLRPVWFYYPIMTMGPGTVTIGFH